MTSALSPIFSSRKKMDTPTGSFYEHFANAAASFSSRPAILVQRSRSVDVCTYAELRRTAERIGAFLGGRGVRLGDRCAILSENDTRWAAAFLAVLRIGGVAVPLDTAYKAGQIGRLVDDCGARVLLVSPRHLDTAQEAVRGRADSLEIFLLHGDHGTFPTLDQIADCVGENLPIPAIGPEEPAAILYTSGTTGDPKGVVLTHGNLAAESDAVFDRLAVDERDSILGVLPLFHALALVGNLLLPLVVGASVVYLENTNTTELLRALRERGTSIFACVPQFFYLIHQRIAQQLSASGRAKRALFRLLLRCNGMLRRRTGLNLGPLFFRRVHLLFGRRMRLMLTGGSRFDPAIGKIFYSLGFTIIQGYGLTECSAGATILQPGDPNVASVGQPLKGVEVSILPREGTANDPGGVADGEILIRGRNVMPGYHNRPDASAEILRDGWLHSGDLGYLDGDGRLFVTGRIKEIIVTSSGKNIYPEEIEAHYEQSAYIKEICVIGLARPEEPSAERLHAVVVPDFDVLRERKMVNAKEIVRWEIESLSVHLPSHKRVLSYELWNEELPRTTTRKLRRFQIAERVSAARQGAAAMTGAGRAMGADDVAWAAQPGVARALAAIREAARHKDAVHPDANLELELGLDSMERVELLSHLEQIFGLRVPEQVAQRIYTVRELVEAVARGAAGAAETAGGDSWGRLLTQPMEADPVLAGLLRPKPFVVAFLFSALRILRALAWLLLGFRVRGLERLPRAGPFMLCPNHQSYLDAFLLASALPLRTFRNLFLVGASEYFATPLMRWVAGAINLVPIDPDTNLTPAMQAGAFGLRHRKVLILFPEGERSIDGRVKRFKKGAPILSVHLQAEVVPIAIEGAFEIWARGRPFSWSALWRRKRSPLRLTFGPPLPAPPRLAETASLRDAEAAYSCAAESLRSEVIALAPSLKDGPAHDDDSRILTFQPGAGAG